MSEPTGKEMKKWLSDFECKYYSIGVHHPDLIVPVTERDKEIFKAIMDAIENMDRRPKVSREFIHKKTLDMSSLLDHGYPLWNKQEQIDFIEKQLCSIVIELGHEVERKKEAADEH